MSMRASCIAVFAAVAVAQAATAADVTCFQGDRAQGKLSGVSSPDSQDVTTISLWAGSNARSVKLADIESIAFTRPANRMMRKAFASMKMRGKPAEDVTIFLPAVDRTLELEGAAADGKRTRLDALSCDRLEFAPG
jgi:hypothetical protein